MHPTFNKLLKPIKDKSLSVGQRRFYAIREIALTQQAIDILKRAGDTEGLQFGEEYLRTLRQVALSEGLVL